MPFRRCCSADVVKARCSLGGEVRPRSVDAHVRDRGTHLDHRAGWELYVPSAVLRIRVAGTGVDSVAVPGGIRGEGLAELHGEVHRVGVSLAAESAAGRPSRDRGAVLT